jgi:hypothetical protein
MSMAGSGLVAGPRATLPSAAENSLWWHGQLITPSAIPVTAQPWCVHVDENALNWPFTGWVMTSCRLSKILPPPSGMSAVFASTVPGDAADPVEPDDDVSSDPHAVSATASPATPTAATTVRRAGSPWG